MVSPIRAGDRAVYNIEWNDSIVVGVPSIDRDHRMLVDMLNELFAACFAGRGPDVLVGIVTCLVDYTRYHFDREEKLLAQAGYDAVDAHRAMHARMVAQVEKIRSDLQQGATHDLSNATLKFLSRWLTDHIQSEDRKFGALMKSRGLD